MYRFRKDLEKRKPAIIDVPLKKHMMCLNESSLDPYQLIKATFLNKMENVHLNRYFQDITAELEHKLTDYIGFGLTSENFVYGNGADEMLYYLFTSLRGREGDYAYSLAPSYFDYKTYSTAIGMPVKFQHLNEDFDFDVDEYIAEINKPECRLAILCNPNNPTGNLLNTEKIIKIIESTDKPVLIDETYYEFSGVTFADKLSEYDNLILIRSFSKAFSSAGLRFGYMLSNRKYISEIGKVMTFFHMSNLTKTFVCSILEHKNEFLGHNELVISERDKTLSELSCMKGLKCHKTDTNFIPFTIGRKSAELHQYLSDNEIAVRAIGAHPLLRNYLRVTIASPEQNEYFINTVKAFLEKE